MAKKAPSTAIAVWHHLVEDRKSLIDGISGRSDFNEESERRLAAIEEQMLDLEAPDIKGILLKLEMLWSARLDGRSPDARHRRKILADLQNLAQ